MESQEQQTEKAKGGAEAQKAAVLSCQFRNLVRGQSFSEGQMAKWILLYVFERRRASITPTLGCQARRPVADRCGVAAVFLQFLPRLHGSLLDRVQGPCVSRS